MPVLCIQVNMVSHDHSDQNIEANLWQQVNGPAFISDLSHELRSLIGGIISINALMLASTLNEQQRELSETIEQSSQALLSMLDDAVQLGRIELSGLREANKPVDIGKISNDAVTAQSEALTINGNQVSLRLLGEIKPEWLGDPVHIERVLSLLLSQCNRLTSNGKIEIDVSLSAAPEQKKGQAQKQEQRQVLNQEQKTERDISANLRVCLKAHPVNESQGKQAGALNQPGQHGGRYDSSWLGLALCHRLVHRLGGQCQSRQVEQTVELEFSLPLRQAPPLLTNR